MSAIHVSMVAVVASATLLVTTNLASGLDLPGILNAGYNITVKNNEIPPIPADFFAPGSAAISEGTEFSLGACDATDGCRTILPNNVLIFRRDAIRSSASTINLELENLSLLSTAPIDVGGGLDPYDMIVSLVGLPAGPAGQPSTIPPGVGTYDSFFDLDYQIDFRNTVTGAPATGGALTGTLRLSSPAGPWFYDVAGDLLIPGSDGFSISPISFSSPDGGLTITGTAVPEPTSLALIGLGGLILLGPKRCLTRTPRT